MMQDLEEEKKQLSEKKFVKLKRWRDIENVQEKKYVEA